jgi:tetraacyldisaccharide 4'-kinase
VFGAVRRLGAARWLDGDGPPPAPAGARVLAVSAIARPGRFAADLAAAGWRVVGELPFRDHHPFTRADLDRIARRAAAAGADLVLTTEKDRVRLLPLRPAARTIAWVPLETGVEPAAAFQEWLLGRLAAARGR